MPRHTRILLIFDPAYAGNLLYDIRSAWVWIINSDHNMLSVQSVWQNHSVPGNPTLFNASPVSDGKSFLILMDMIEEHHDIDSISYSLQRLEVCGLKFMPGCLSALDQLGWNVIDQTSDRACFERRV
ncbi:hypothetical protein [Hyphomonas pacifica]|uniref:Uncharacterized protein n=1 Tax=Hyphomonas pacifica TaxID=1280941 RepID=A0A062TQ47_9PROT|nr:hypothetical protein [Hyphomonas pacifica]KCZ49264.1 hypothetical protein HY2_15320 [Hyphomonas pacifica]RAN31901.1 hypothetical protein HY3_16105 [Hyphomonas pacifica]